MRRIDPETVRKILDTADIVEVESDFVNLKRRGANYMGLCPFHNERTPSFSVSKAKGYCKCFSCGKGGSAVGFIMEHEQLGYGEALRWLANKYGIEVAEEEMTPEQMEAATERESMLALNDFALRHFEHNITENPDGRAIGLSYFRERGITDAAIKRFRLGYALDRWDALLSDALNKGYSEKLLLDTGLCGKSERGQLFDRFRGRVIYPVFALSGKVVAFGGRTLRKDKDVSKYVNSPESVIYHKSNQLYGLYQARRAIVSADKCILVEGYMDVISMSQRGMENVVASSGTSLTDGQISLIHRFTENVTVIYDSDAAGIKASLRGIDMLLAEGLNIKVMLLPDGEDPDSFAQAHTLEQIQAYMAEHETDFLRFKTQVLLKDVAANDPIGRSRVITDIVRSISVIPNDVTRNEYVKECSRLLGANEDTLALQVAKFRAQAADVKAGRTRPTNENSGDESAIVTDSSLIKRETAISSDRMAYLRPYELATLRLVLKYGMIHLCDVTDNEGNIMPVRVIDFIDSELAQDDMTFCNADLLNAYNAAMGLTDQWRHERAAKEAEVEEIVNRHREEGVKRIMNEATTLAQTKKLEDELGAEIENMRNSMLDEFDELFISRLLASDPDDTLRRLAANMVSEKYQLSRIHTKHSKVETERDCLADRVPKAVYGWKNAVLKWQEKELRRLMTDAAANNDSDRVNSILTELMELRGKVTALAKYLGERIVLPRK
ncbi:MAG: DNA primase [Muribaculaceae bacterium]|nr:DNA primase [Muribaculaceae bacterium]